MRSRRDQVQAHAYVVGRLTSALVHAEPDSPESPLRRTSLGSFGGVMIGALLVAAFLVWGLISPASKASALTTGELVMVRETGARYIYAKGQLHPILNWSSALLLLAGNPAMKAVTAKSLKGIPAGQPLGIVGAPDALPAATAINQGSWLVCAQVGGGRPLVSLTIGDRQASAPVSAGGAVLVQAPDGSRYVLYRGHRMRLDAPWIQNALGLGRAPVIDVNAAWLNAVPAAPDLRPIAVTGRGRRGPALSGQRTRVGQVLVVHNVGSPDAFYLTEPSGVTPVTPTQAAILLTDHVSIAAYHGTTVAPMTVSPAALTGATVVHPVLADGPAAPASPPADYAPGTGVPCMDYAGAGGRPPVLVFARPPAGAPPALSMPGVSASPEGADLISVVPDGGALVHPEAAPGIGASSLFLVTDAGVRFPVPSAKAARALGYRPARAARLPAALLGLLPTGPALDLPAMRG